MIQFHLADIGCLEKLEMRTRKHEGNRIGDLGCSGWILCAMHLKRKCENVDRVRWLSVSYSPGVLHMRRRIAVCVKGGQFPDK
jgi:hypothetical protein